MPLPILLKRGDLEETIRTRTEPRTKEIRSVPLIKLTCDRALGERVLRELAELLPDIVAEAVDCPEEPWIGPPEPGDIEIRFRQKSLLDVVI